MVEALPDLAAKQSVIFDLDGTLIDSSAAHGNAYKRALAAQHPELARRFDYERVRGMPTPAAMSLLGIVDQAENDRLTRDKRERYLQALAAGTVSAFPGAHELVERLAASGRRLFVVTAASGRAAHTILERVGLAVHFTFVLTVEGLVGSKESGLSFELCVERFDLERQTTLVVEDAADGIAGALAAGLEVVQVHRRVVDGVPFCGGLADLLRAFGL